MFQIKAMYKITTHIFCSVVFFLNDAVYEIIWKNILELSSATDDNMVHAHSIAGHLRLHTQVILIPFSW